MQAQLQTWFQTIWILHMSIVTVYIIIWCMCVKYFSAPACMFKLLPPTQTWSCLTLGRSSGRIPLPVLQWLVSPQTLHNYWLSTLAGVSSIRNKKKKPFKFLLHVLGASVGSTVHCGCFFERINSLQCHLREIQKGHEKKTVWEFQVILNFIGLVNVRIVNKNDSITFFVW